MWQILLGLFVATEKLVPLCRFHTRKAQHCISQHWDFSPSTSGRRGSTMVDVGTHCSDGSSGNPEGSRCIFVHRCVKHRLGCALELLDSLWCLADDRESTSHQCARVRGHTPNSASLAEAAHRPNSSCCVGQLHGSILHQQAGRDTVNIAVQTDQEVPE